MVFLFTNNKYSKNEILKTIPFTKSSKKKKLPINITKEIKDTYIKVLNLKKSTKTPEYGKTSHFHGLTDKILCNGHSRKSNYRFNAIPSILFTEIETIILKFVWTGHRPPDSQSNPEKNK